MRDKLFVVRVGDENTPTVLPFQVLEQEMVGWFQQIESTLQNVELLENLYEHVCKEKCTLILNGV